MTHKPVGLFGQLFIDIQKLLLYQSVAVKISGILFFDFFIVICRDYIVKYLVNPTMIFNL
jgi:hypothetical protein